MSYRSANQIRVHVSMVVSALDANAVQVGCGTSTHEVGAAPHVQIGDESWTQDPATGRNVNSSKAG